MERPKTVLGQRSASFNPEAATFSPSRMSFETRSPVATASTPYAIPRELFRASTVLEQDSLFRPTENMRPVYHSHEEADSSHTRLEDLLSRDMPLDALQKMLQDHNITLTPDTGGASFQEHTAPTETAYRSMAQLPPSIFPPALPEPNFSAVDVDELSASLGLPGMKKNGMTDGSPARLHKSCPSEDLPDTLYARYLNGESVISGDMTAASRDAQESLMGFGTPERLPGQGMKVIRPPPGFDTQLPRKILDEDYTAPAVMEPKYVPTGPAMLSYARQNSPFQPITHGQHHARRLSSRRRPRAHTRVKRTDQGPEPSAADIYPDDANWVPSGRPLQHNVAVNVPVFVPHSSPPLEFHVKNALSWPTPAEVYTHKPETPLPKVNVFEEPVSPAQVYTHKPDTPPFNILEDHVSPEAIDIKAADDDVLVMMNELPDPSYGTLLNFGAFDMLCDERPLTPCQFDGSRYGMRYYGLGLGDTWKCPDADEGGSFRVRPRNHEGWGGWEWALKGGWADE